jgi:hypothetical protein
LQSTNLNCVMQWCGSILQIGQTKFQCQHTGKITKMTTELLLVKNQISLTSVNTTCLWNYRK